MRIARKIFTYDPLGRRYCTDITWSRVGRRGWYELDDYWRKERESGRAVDIPAEVFREPGEYRVRARWRDGTGRYGHWSSPVNVNVR